MYTNYSNNPNDFTVMRNSSYYGPYDTDDRFFWAPFVVGGLAGTALGYGIANNNQIHNQGFYPYPIYPAYPPYPIFPTYSSNNYYY